VNIETQLELVRFGKRRQIFKQQNWKMSKTMGRMKMGKKLIEKIDHSSKLRVDIPAGMASSAPPLGSQLGQV